MKKILIISLSCCFYSILISQVTQVWVNRYNFIGEDEAYAVSVDSQNNACVTGRTWNGVNYDITAIMYSVNGSTIWIKTFNGIENRDDEPRGIIVDNENNILIGGNTNIGVSINSVLIKYSSAGILNWVKYFNNHTLNCYITDLNNNIYIACGGSTYNSTFIRLIKYNKFGDFIWSKIYIDSVFDHCYPVSIKIDGVGNLVITGTAGTGAEGSDIIVSKYDTSGNKIWNSRTPPGFNYEQSLDLCIGVNNSIWISGSYSDINTNYPDYYTLMYNKNGILKWSRTYTMYNYYDYAYSISCDNNGNAFVTGRCGNHIFTIKYDSIGSILWSRTIDEFFGSGNQIKSDSSGNSYITGWILLPPNNNLGDYITLKYSPNGSLLWQVRYDGPSGNDDKASSIIVGKDNCVYVTGQSFGNHYDYCTVKYSQAIGINKISDKTPGNFSLHQNYPNPFNPVTKIRFDIPSLVRRGAGVVVLKIYDLLGREVATLVNEQLKPGTYEVEWPAPTGDGASFSSGIYFYKLITNDYIESKKMILIK